MQYHRLLTAWSVLPLYFKAFLLQLQNGTNHFAVIIDDESQDYMFQMLCFF